MGIEHVVENVAGLEVRFVRWPEGWEAFVYQGAHSLFQHSPSLSDARWRARRIIKGTAHREGLK